MITPWQERLSVAKALFQDESFEQAYFVAREIIDQNPECVEALHLQGIILCQLGRYAEGEVLFLSALALEKENYVVTFNLAKCVADQGRHAEAILWYKITIELNQEYDKAWLNYGLLLKQRGDVDGAVAAFDHSLFINKNFAEAYCNKAISLQGKLPPLELISLYDRAISLKPSLVEAWIYRGTALRHLKRYGDATASYLQAITLNQQSAEAWLGYGNTLREQARYEEALTCYNKLLSVNPESHEGWSNLGNTLADLRRYVEALKCYELALAIRDDVAGTWTCRGNTLTMLQRFEEALESHNRALILDSQSIDALNNRGNTLNLMRCHDEAALCFLEAYRLKGESGFSLGRAHHQMMLCANWDDFDKFTLDINEGVLLGNLVAEPFGYQGICESEKHLRICAESFSSRFFPQLSFEAFVHDRVKKDKIRIGYLCGEFRDHATTHLMIGVWEQHNKDHFELYAFDNGHDDKSSYRGRVENAFSRIFSISSLSDREVAQLIYGCGIHILIDMNVYFGNSRHGILSFRPAPVQINFLGFPGTSGAPYVDYIIADENVIPKGSARFYTESIIYLPDTYQANDDRRTYPIIKLHRSDFGLPDNVFVFCCFNNNYKITPAVFKVWMSILTTCENSVLWLLEDNNSAKSNLLLSAQRLGVSPGRLVFSGRVPCYEHLNRHQLADLFLDTWPYNAHTTASDALWCCLPLITLCGTTFPGRVAASLLRAIGMPELVTTDVAQYEALAIELASHPTRVTELRNKLIQNRCTQPLFNTTLYTQHLECSYRKVYNRYISGLDPTSFTICPSSSVPRSLPSHQSL